MATTERIQRAGAALPARHLSENCLDRSEAPVLHLTLWPHRSLSRVGYGNVMRVAAAGLALPLAGTLGSPVIWMLLPFAGATLLALWWSIRRNNRDAALTETLCLWHDLIRVERREPNGTVRHWQANPYWVSVRIHTGSKLKNYLTLKGNGRKIELGTFLSPDERLTLHDDIEAALHEIRSAPLPFHGTGQPGRKDRPTVPRMTE